MVVWQLQGKLESGVFRMCHEASPGQKSRVPDHHHHAHGVGQRWKGFWS